MQTATRKDVITVSEPAQGMPARAAKTAKLSVILITRDDLLWPQIGALLGNALILRQVDSIDEMVSATPAGQPAIILWDARNQPDLAGSLSRLQLHSPRFAVIALDEADSAQNWTNPIALRQVVADAAVPIVAEKLTAALESAREEVNVRVALLGDAADTVVTPGPRRIPWLFASSIGAALIACAVAFVVFRHGPAAVTPAPAASPQRAPQETAGQTAGPIAGADEKIDLLIEKAQQAMLERHFIDPVDGSALTLYRNALLLDPDNGEARQGLQRLGEILITRVQSALDERRFDVALQALETARRINPSDSRLTSLDDRIASLRAEFGPAQILAAINAQNFDRAAQLIDDAARTKSLTNPKLVQLRDELRRRHEEFDIANFMKLMDARLQQDKLVEPRNDSAVYYLGQARQSGASAAALQSPSQEIYKRLAQNVHAAIDQRRFNDADRLLAEMHGYWIPVANIASLQRDLAAARGQSAAAAPEPQYIDLAQSRLSQGKITEPDNDSALFYINQLKAADPKNSGLPRISSAVQGLILEQARAALDSNQPARAEALLQMAAGLGASADLAALNQRLGRLKIATTAAPEVTESALTRLAKIQLDYPYSALRKNIEGWVELSYAVTEEGNVTAIKVLASSPPGVFDSAAVKAMSRLRYKPMLQGGKPIAVVTQLRIAFRMTT